MLSFNFIRFCCCVIVFQITFGDLVSSVCLTPSRFCSTSSSYSRLHASSINLGWLLTSWCVTDTNPLWCYTSYRCQHIWRSIVYCDLTRSLTVTDCFTVAVCYFIRRHLFSNQNWIFFMLLSVFLSILVFWHHAYDPGVEPRDNLCRFCFLFFAVWESISCLCLGTRPPAWDSNP